MKTELIHSYSSASLAAIARSDSNYTFAKNGELNAGSKTALEDNGVEKGSSMVGHIFHHLKSNFCRRKTLEKKFPVIKWIPQYSREKLIADMIAGLTVGLTILPQGLAYATVAGLPPQYGLYSGFVGCFVYIFFGSSNVITIGPTAITAIITYTYTHGKPPEYAVLLCFLNGIVTFLMGLFQLGFIVNFISTPVNAGFISAAAITIISTQLKSLLGLKFRAEGFIATVTGIITNITDVKGGDAILSFGCITSLLVLMKLEAIVKYVIGENKVVGKLAWFLSTSRNAIVVIGTTFLAAYLPKGIVETIGKIQPGLPPIQSPPFNILDKATNITHSFVNILQEEGSATIVIPLLCIMEHITVAKAFAGESILDPNQEMISIGVSNIIGSFASSMPVTGSLSRTAVNAMSGAMSPLGGIVTGTIVILSLQFLTPLFYNIPKAALASVIVCAVIFMVDYEVVAPMYRSKKMDFIPMILTFCIALLIGLEFGMMCGFLISVTYLLYYAARPGVKVKKGYTTKQTEFILVELDRSLTFPSVEYIRYVITKSSSSWGQNKMPVVVDCIHIQFADFTAAQGIRDVVKAFNKRNQTFMLWRVKPSLVRILEGTQGAFTYCYSEHELEQFLDTRTKSELCVHTPHLIRTQRDTFSAIPLS